MTNEILAPRIGIDATYRQLAAAEVQSAAVCSDLVSILQRGPLTAYSVDQAATEIRKAREHLRRANEFNRLADERGEK